jgi:ribonuclease HI
MLKGSFRKEFHKGFELTTNNRMDLLAVIVALESVKKEQSDILVYSDSKYVVNAVEKKMGF